MDGTPERAARLFTAEELAELPVPLPDRIRNRIDAGDIQEALQLTRQMSESRVDLHDLFADSCTVLWSWTGKTLGEEAVEDLFRYVFEHSARRQLYTIGILFRLYQRFAVSLLAESGWRAHSCFGSGEHPARFSVTEDAEKFSFHMKPCASGARLWLRGLYEPGRGGTLSEKAHWWTWNRTGFPTYCMHCPFLNEVLPYETMGHLLWPVDELQSPDDVCTWHLYKDPNAIPHRYYARLGLTKRLMMPVKAKRQKDRYFTDEELRDLSRPMTDRITEALQDGNLKEAKKLCAMVKDEFLFLHDLYMNMLLATLTFIAEHGGEDALGEALRVQYETCVANRLLPRIKQMTPKERAGFLAVNIFGTDACSGTGFPPRASFTVRETERSIIFTLDPCGSGGRLLRGGAYRPMSFLKKQRERLEDRFVVTASKLFPIPDAFLELAFSLTGGYVCQRKPYGQGRTRHQHTWSFGREDMPYYCCQCGTLQEHLDDDILTISPPRHEKDPCVWILNKDIRS